MAVVKTGSGKRSVRQSLTHLEHAEACAGAGDYQRALAIVENVVEDDDLNGAAYRLLAWIAVTADDDVFRDLPAAKENLQIADDLARGHENDHVRALIAHADGDMATARSLLKKAMQLDANGFGYLYYWCEGHRLKLFTGDE